MVTLEEVISTVTEMIWDLEEEFQYIPLLF